MLHRQTQPQSYRELLATYHASVVSHASEKLRFGGIGERDVYNITAPFRDDGELIIAGRVEDRASERSTTHFFVERGAMWIPRDNTPVFALQDPFVTRIAGELVLGGVEVTFDEAGRHVTSWRTQFYRAHRCATCSRSPPDRKE
jgi:hypothetical protein